MNAEEDKQLPAHLFCAKNNVHCIVLSTVFRDIDKLKFVLCTGSESTEEKEIIRNINNSSSDLVPAFISKKLHMINKDDKNIGLFLQYSQCHQNPLPSSTKDGCSSL